MKAVFTRSNKKKFKYLFSNHFMDLKENDVLCFSDLESMNDKKNLKKLTELTIMNVFGNPGYGHFSGCHKINKDIFAIDNDQDGLQANIHSVHKNNTFVGIFINCGAFHPNDFFEKSLKSKKKYLEFSFEIKSNKLILFGVNDCEWIKKKKEKLTTNANDLINDKTKNNKFLEFEVEKGKYNIYTFFDDDFDDSQVSGHFIELEMNKKEALRLVKKDGSELNKLATHFKKDKDIVLSAVKQMGNAISYADESLRKDKKIALAAVKQNGTAIDYVDESLKKDEKFIEAIDWDAVNNAFAEAVGMSSLTKKEALEYVKEDGLQLKFLHHLKKDKKIVLEAAKQNVVALEYADESLINDRNFILKVMKHNANAVFFADKKFKKDKKLVLIAVKKDEEAFDCIDDSLKKDEKFVLNILKQGSYILPFCGDNFYKNKEIILEAQKLLNKKITLLSKKKTDVNKKEIIRWEHFLSEIKKKRK